MINIEAVPTRNIPQIKSIHRTSLIASSSGEQFPQILSQMAPQYHHHRLAAILLLLFSLIPNFSSALSSSFSPGDHHLLNCGSATPFLSDRRLFLPDAPFLLPHFLLPHSSSLSLSLSSPSSLPSLYSTARLFTAPASYSFPISSKSPHLLLRLHFHPFSSSVNLSDALFHVSASGFLLLSHFRPTAAPAPLVKDFSIPLPASAPRNLLLSFIPATRSSFAFVNAIELFSAPHRLVPDTARLVLINGIQIIHGLASNAMDTVYRINVGGSKVTPVNDTLWRTWTPDAGFFSPSSSHSREVSFSGRIAYRKFGASREIAPDSVYGTARVLDGGSVENSTSHMTWAFDVSPGYKYLIRMHFCDIASLALNELYFNVYVNELLAYENFDISAAAELVLASPYYMDFVADADDSGALNVSVSPSRMAGHLKVGALLNGLEIMKINNTAGSLSGVVPLSMVIQRTARVGFGAFFRSLLCGIASVSLCMIAFTLVMRLKAETRNRGAWSLLPRDSEGSLGDGKMVSPGKFVSF